MAQAAITLEILPAGYGDCLLVQCPVGKRTWRLVVDTGPDERFPQLKARLATLPVDAEGKRHIDLFIVTHIDHDHIGGASLLLNDKSLNLSFGDIWFNAPIPARAARGVAEGVSLAKLLGAKERPLPWNRAFGGQHAVTSGDAGYVEVPVERDTPRITLLSPTPDRLTAVFKVWARELEKLSASGRERAAALPSAMRGPVTLDIDALAAKSTPVDRAAPNGSSIAVLLEHRGASVLLGADAFAAVLTPALKALALQRGISGPLPVDVFKLSHHGSRCNTTRELLAAVHAQHYVFSTNNTIFNHPDDETVARVIKLSGAQASLWFNYSTARNLRWAELALQAERGYSAHYPLADSLGVTITLPGVGRR